MNTFEKDSTYIAGTYKRFPVEIVSGKGAILKGSDGKDYIDLGSGIGVNAFGAGDDEFKAAVISQLDLSSILPISIIRVRVRSLRKNCAKGPG